MIPEFRYAYQNISSLVLVKLEQITNFYTNPNLGKDAKVCKCFLIVNKS